MPDPIQGNRDIQVTTVLGDNQLLFSELQGTERLSNLFNYQLDLVSTDFEIDLDKLLGTNITVTVNHARKGTRYFNGYVSSCSNDTSDDDFARYRFTLRPWFWFLTRTTDCRIFQNKSVSQIIEEVFREEGSAKFENRLTGKYDTWDYCVQYRETDYNFLSRLMEQEGIYYYFTHEQGVHKLILCDSISAHEPAKKFETIQYFPAAENRIEDHLNKWELSRNLQPRKFVIKDFNYEDPKSDLKVGDEFSVSHANADYEIFDYPGEYIKRKSGEKTVEYRMQESQAQSEIMEGSGNVQGMATGNLFTLENSERSDQDQEYLLIGAGHHLSLGGYRSGDGGSELSMNCSLQCIPASQQFRAPRLTPKPTMSGPQTAIVVGPVGEEIWTDKLGRVKLQFHWDRYGKSNETSSCWVRVSQAWAGAGWGAMFIPRIGQEVIVECLEGDPDQPIVTGRVYNGDNAVPYDLPANQTQSGIKSRSTTGGQSQNFNEIRMEDKKGEEEIYIHAEKDMNVVVENDSSLKIGFEKEDKGDYTVDVKNDRTATIDSGDDKLVVKKGNREVEVSKGNHKMKVGTGTSTIEAAKSITLKVGGNSIVIDQKGVTIKGMKVAIEGKTTAEMKGGVSATVSGGAKAELKGPMVDVKGDAMVKIQGGITLIN